MPIVIVRHRGPEASVSAGPVRRQPPRRQRRQRARGGLRHLRACRPAPSAGATAGSSTVARPGSPPGRSPTCSSASPATDPSRGILGISAFLIERDTPGFRVVREIPKLGMQTVPMGELAFEDCTLPLGCPARARGPRAPRSSTRPWSSSGASILASALGTMRRQLERCIEPRPDAEAVRPADRQVPVGLQPDRRHGHAAGDEPAAGLSLCLAEGPGARTPPPPHRWPSSRSPSASCRTASTPSGIFGAAGYAEETGLERDLRDSVGGVIFSGTNDIQRNIIAQHLRLG